MFVRQLSRLWDLFKHVRRLAVGGVIVVSLRTATLFGGRRCDRRFFTDSDVAATLEQQLCFDNDAQK